MTLINLTNASAPYDWATSAQEGRQGPVSIHDKQLAQVVVAIEGRAFCVAVGTPSIAFAVYPYESGAH